MTIFMGIPQIFMFVMLRFNLSMCINKSKLKTNTLNEVIHENLLHKCSERMFLPHLCGPDQYPRIFF